jgi:integrase
MPVLDKSGKPKKRKLTAEEIKYNTETRDQAREGLVKRQGMLNKGDYSFLSSKSKPLDFITYCEQITKERTGSTVEGWTSFVQHLKKYSNGSVPITNLNRTFCENFKKHLLSTLSTNTAATYYNKFKAALRQAHRGEPQLLTIDLSTLTEAIPEEKKHRNYLTAEELQALIDSPCALPLLKNAAIFSALTGLRYGDIEKMTWKELQYSKSYGNVISYTTQKTGKADVHPIPEDAVSAALIGQRRGSDDKVFTGLAYSNENNKIMRKWVSKAGITKHIVFHSFRHTYGTLQKERGVDTFVIKKGMTHNDIKTTEDYAAIRDPARRAAADLMNTFDLSKI